MPLRFTITDNTQSPAVDTVVDEPIGFDGMTVDLSRINDYHGFVDFWDDTLVSLQWYNSAFAIIKTAFDTYGVQSQMNLKIEFACDDNDTYDIIYEGQFNFDTYKCIEGEKCYIDISIETSNGYMVLKNRIDTKVDIGLAEDFDGNSLTPYDKIDADITIPSIPLELFSHGNISDDFKLEIREPSDHSGNYSEVWFSPLTINGVTDLQEFIGGTGTTFNGASGGDGLSETFKNVPDVDYSNTPTFVFDFSIDWAMQCKAAGGLTGSIHCYVYTGVWISSMAPNVLYQDSNVYGFVSFDTIVSGNFSQTLSAVTLNTNEEIRLLMTFQFTAAVSPQDIDFDIMTDGGYMKISRETIFNPTMCKANFINETASRIVEHVTDDKLRVYSDYFGRIDAQPYPSDENGCMGGLSLTTGKMLRKLLLEDGTEPKMFLSFKQLIQALNAICNIGYCVEDDPNRAGYKLIRIEPMEYFYQSSVVFTAKEPMEIKKSVKSDLYFTNFKSGYSTYKAAQYSGIKDLFSPREYATQLTSSQKTYDRTCDFIASPIAIEGYRRYINQTNKDFSYDDDTFLVYHKLTEDSGDNIYEVQMGRSIITPPSTGVMTLFNIMISPLRNAMRHFKYVLSNYKSLSSVLKFKASEANFVVYTAIDDALIDPDAPCIMEDFPLKKEDINIDLSDFNTPADHNPLFTFNEIEFDYPVSWQDFKNIMANPYGKIEYIREGISYFGYLQRLKYNMYGGKATFILKEAV